MRNNTNQLHVWLNNEEMNLIKENSKLMGLTVTDYVKLMCNLIPVCESYEERIQREQQELNDFIDRQEKDEFEHEIQMIENDFVKRFEADEIAPFERKLYVESLEREIEYHDEKLDTLKYNLDEWVREPFIEAP